MQMNQEIYWVIKNFTHAIKFVHIISTCSCQCLTLILKPTGSEKKPP